MKSIAYYRMKTRNIVRACRCHAITCLCFLVHRDSSLVKESWALLKSIVCILLAVAMTGCASVKSTITDGHMNRTTLDVPSNAAAAHTWTGNYEAKGVPAFRFIEIPRGDGPFRGNHGYVVDSKGIWIADIRPGVNWWIMGNIVLGGPLPWIFDLVSGGAFEPHLVPQ